MIDKILTVAALAVVPVTTMPVPTASASEVQPNLVGGHQATGDTSWMAAIQYDAPKYGKVDAFYCGATLIFRDWVVTNAHCVTDMPQTPVARTKNTAFSGEYRSAIPAADKTFKVRVGSKDRTTGGETAKVTGIYYPAAWSWGTNPVTEPQSDIAMLHLDHLVNQQPIQLAGRDAKAGDKITLYGWGADTPAGNDPLPTQLQQLETTVLKSSRCDPAGISPGEICTDNPHKTDGPGGGDSGGPAIKMENGLPKLVGGCSRAAAQYPGEAPTVYTSQPYFRDWIYGVARDVAVTA